MPPPADHPFDDTIEIAGLELDACVGVPEAERINPQRLLVDLSIVPLAPFHALADDIALTVDYEAVAKSVAGIAAARPRKLIETLAQEIAMSVIENFPAQRACVRIRKFILPRTEFVAVHCSRERQVA